MTKQMLLAASVSLMFCACNAEIRLGAREGVRPLKGSTRCNTEMFRCGETLEAEGRQVFTTPVGNNCRLSFEEHVTVCDEEDYRKIQEFRTVASATKAVELEVRQLQFLDGDTGREIDLDTYVKNAELRINGQLLVDRSDLANLPKVVRLEGPALEELKAFINARRPATVRVSAVLEVPLEPRIPRALVITYAVQPTLILGPQEGKVTTTTR